MNQMEATTVYDKRSTMKRIAIGSCLLLLLAVQAFAAADDDKIKVAQKWKIDFVESRQHRHHIDVALVESIVGRPVGPGVD